MADDKLGKSIQNIEEQLQQQSRLLNYLLDRVEAESYAAQNDRIARRIDEAARRFEESYKPFDPEAYKHITPQDGLFSAGGKGLLAFAASLNPITALMYQGGGQIFNTARNIGNFAGNAFLSARNALGNGINAVSNLFHRNNESTALTTTNGTAVGMLENKEASLQSIDNLQIKEVTNLKVDNTAAAQLKIHQAMIWADQAVLITKNNMQGGNSEDVLAIEDKTAGSIETSNEPEPTSVKLTRILSQGFKGLSDSFTNATKVIKDSSGIILLSVLGIGALGAAIWALIELLKKFKNPLNPDGGGLLPNPNSDEVLRQASNTNTISSGMNLGSMNSNTIQQTLSQLWNGQVTGRMGTSNNAFWDYSDGAVNSATYQTTRGKRTPVILGFDGTVKEIKPMSNMQTPQFEITIERMTRSGFKNPFNKESNLVVFRGIIEPLVYKRMQVPKGYIIGFSEGAFTIVGKNEELVNNYMEDIAPLSDSAVDTTMETLNLRTSVFGDNTILDRLNNEQMAQTLESAKSADEAAHPIRTATADSMLKGAATGAGLGAFGGLVPALIGGVVGAGAGTVYGLTGSSAWVAQQNLSSGEGLGAIVDNFTKNGTIINNNAATLNNAQLDHRQPPPANPQASNNLSSANTGGTTISAPRFGLDDEKDILAACAQYTDNGMSPV